MGRRRSIKSSPRARATAPGRIHPRVYCNPFSHPPMRPHIGFFWQFTLKDFLTHNWCPEWFHFSIKESKKSTQ